MRLSASMSFNGSFNGLSAVRSQVITWNKTTYLKSDFKNTFQWNIPKFKNNWSKIHWNISAKFQRFCLGLKISSSVWFITFFVIDDKLAVGTYINPLFCIWALLCRAVMNRYSARTKVWDVIKMSCDLPCVILRQFIYLPHVLVGLLHMVGQHYVWQCSSLLSIQYYAL